MVATTDYAKLGKTTWRASVQFDDGNDAFAREEWSGEYPNKGLARMHAARALRAAPVPPPAVDGESQPNYWARIQRGTYQDNSFDDHGYGRVGDAMWELDKDGGDNVEEFGYVYEGGEVKWSS